MAPLGDSDISEQSSFDFDPAACMARDEAAELRNEVCRLQVRLEEVEDERNYTAAKANEFEEALRSFKQDHIHEELVRKSLQVAEMNMTLDLLQSRIKSLTDANQNLKLARKEDHNKLVKVSDVVRSLQCAETDDEESDEEEEVVLTPEKALDMTLKNMKFHIEFLEDERQTLAGKCSTQDKRVKQLQNENEMKDVKIEMLEELFRALNDQRQENEDYCVKKKASESNDSPPTRFAKRPIMRKANSSPSLMEDDSAAERKKQRGSRRASRSSPGTPSLRSRGRKGTPIVVGDDEGTYVGPLKDGKPNGVGTIRFENGETYLGEVVDGKLHGKGTLYTKCGVSRGLFQDNVHVN